VCATCGCSGASAGPAPAERAPAHAHDHAHDGGRLRGAPRIGGAARLVRLEAEVLGKNDRIAAENRAWLADRRIACVNLVSSPGAGKTTLLERTVRALRGEVELAVVEGDQETLLDAERIRATGCRVAQINTGRGCHLDAAMVAGALRTLDPGPGAVVLVENVGNLVCPALFDLGERAKVVVASTPEGDEKPLKYPHMFRASALMLLNKIDLAPHLAFDVERCAAAARSVNPALEILPVSATRGDGLEAWYAWLRAQRAAASAG
jgi:hydrogenase nickel incorporation protein HypB